MGRSQVWEAGGRDGTSSGSSNASADAGCRRRRLQPPPVKPAGSCQRAAAQYSLDTRCWRPAALLQGVAWPLLGPTMGLACGGSSALCGSQGTIWLLPRPGRGAGRAQRGRCGPVDLGRLGKRQWRGGAMLWTLGVRARIDLRSRSATRGSNAGSGRRRRGWRSVAGAERRSPLHLLCCLAAASQTLPNADPAGDTVSDHCILHGPPGGVHSIA